jgi:hypothetical protein
MKTSIQTAVLVGALVVVVFLVTFVSQWVSSGETKTTGPTGPERTKVKTKVRQLEFPIVRVPEKEEDPSILAEMHPQTGHQDFWFRNPHDVSIEMGLEAKSCKCEKVEARLLSPEEEQKYQSSKVAPESGWQLLGNPANAEPPLTVPAGATGLVRLMWDGKAEKKQVLKISVWTAAPGDDLRNVSTLEASVDFVPAFYVNVGTQQLPSPLQEGQKMRVSFIAWSHTRSKMKVTAHERRNDPCFVCEVTPLTPEECERRLPQGDRRPIVSAAQVAVTVFAQRDGHSLDMGPFNRMIEVLCDEDQGLAREVTLSGVVTGNIRLLTADQKDWINLEDFRARDGKTVTVSLEADAVVKDLKIENKTPAYLQVDLTSDPDSPRGKKQWKLKVGVPPGRADGRLPRGSGITLTTLDTPPRRLKIPVLGHATND